MLQQAQINDFSGGLWPFPGAETSLHEVPPKKDRWFEMRRLILLGFVAVMALPALGAKRVTVAQLEEELAAANAAHRSDLEVARQVGSFEMTERLTDDTLNRFADALALGPRTALALQLLADQSAFLNPPANELPATAPPDAETQQRMLDAARAYAVQTWSRMPNFFVTRVTNRFDDTPHALAKGDWPVDLGLQPAGATSRQVAFRDGKEVQDTDPTGGGQKAQQEVGLRSWGEFGPALTVVLGDTAQHPLTFSHWEKTATGLAAVFAYTVPRDTSHYQVTYAYLSQTIFGRTQFGYSGRERTAQQVANIPREISYQTYSENPGYHGTISIDPATGAVMRLTIQAGLGSGDPLLLAETMVQYAPVTIGDRQFICPVRSLAISEMALNGGGSMALNGVGNTSAWGGTKASSGKSTLLLINETQFSQYHRLGSTARIVTDTAGAQPPGSKIPATGQEAVSVPSPADSASSAAAQAPQAAEPQIAANTAPPLSSPASSAPPPTSSAPAEPVIPEVSMAPASSLPDQPVNAPDANNTGGYSLKVTSRLVDVGLVAYDKKGNPVGDLKASDIEVYDNGQKREISSFALATAPAEAPLSPAPQASAPAAAEPAFSNRATGPTTAPSATPATADIGSTILVIDESHIAWNDMNLVRGQILKFLSSLAPAERVGLYSMNGLGFRVLTEVTTDHAALIASMQKFMPTAQFAAQAQEEETRNRQQFDEVHNLSDLNSVNGNHVDVADGSTPIDPQLMTMGDDPARAAFVILTQVARHLASIPGHKKVVWVSSDNVLASWEDQTVGIQKSPKDERSFALRVEETMNEAHAAVYPFDVSQLEGSAITADMQHRNVELTQAATDTASLAPGTPSPSRNITGGRISAEMSQDLHPVQGPVRDVAAATGGRVIRRSGDLTAQLNGIVADEHSTYMLSFSPQTPPDGQYHAINIKLTGRRGLTLRYRTGYLFEKEPSTLKERFQQAVWRPTDVSEIAVTADITPENPGADVKINIAAADLGLQQQAGRWMDRLDIFFIQRDDAGLHAQVEGQSLGLRLRSSTYQRLLPTGVPFSRFVEMHHGMASLRVLVVDENSGRMGSVTIPVSSLGVLGR
jgi:VWFA-related protein